MCCKTAHGETDEVCGFLILELMTDSISTRDGPFIIRGEKQAAESADLLLRRTRSDGKKRPYNIA